MPTVCGKDDKMSGKKTEVFLSYCWEDTKTADEVYDSLVDHEQINLHRDKIDIQKWGSIKDYMQSIGQVDYTILLISESYLKSANCMYEVLEVMRDRRYRDRIFPAIIYQGIYDPLIRAGFVKYWQDELAKLKGVISELDAQNIGPLAQDLKRRQDIASNMAEFLDVISDMNNPQIHNVSDAIKENLEKMEIINKNGAASRADMQNGDLFTKLGISNHTEKPEITDLDVNQFMVGSYHDIQQIFEELCRQFEEKNDRYKIITEAVDTRNSNYQFYKDGQLLISLKISLTDSFGSLNIGISNNKYSYASGNSWNGLYASTILNGALRLKPLLSMYGTDKEMGTDDVVKDIWESYVKPYLYK